MSTLASIAALVLGLLGGVLGPVPPPAVQDDPRVRELVERFFAAQEAEDAAAYLALWSEKAQRPRPEQLRFVFESGDDRFTDIRITSQLRVGDLYRVRVSVRRERTSKSLRPDGTPVVSTSVRAWSLTLADERGELRILSEGFPADDLAAALIAAGTPEARAALMDAEPETLGERLIQAVAGRADGLAQLGNHAGARRIYDVALEVARRAGNRKAEGEALQNIANTHYFETHLSQALERYEERLALEQDGGTAAGRASALLGIATVRYSMFEYGEALAAYRAALEDFEAIGDDASMATALLSTGNVLYLQADLEGAIADYRRSRDLYGATHNTDGQARALAGLGRAYTAQGNYAAALEAFAGVWEEGRARGNRVMQANALHSTGDVHLRLGNAAAARTAFEESREHLEAADDMAGVGLAWQGIAVAELLAGRFAAAEQAYASSIKRCTAAAERDCIARAIVGLGYAQYAQDKYADAAASYREGIKAFTALGKAEEIGRAAVGLAQALVGLESFKDAIAAAVMAREHSPVLDVVWRAHLVEARALRRTDRREDALSAAAAAVEAVETLAREALDRPALRLAPDTAGAYTFLAILLAEHGDARAAFATIERRHAHGLRVALGPHERHIVRRMSDEERAAERDTTRRLASLQAQIEKEKSLPRPDADRIATLEEEASDALAARTAQRERLFAQWPELRTWRALNPAATIDEVEAFVLAEGTAVLELVMDRDDLLVLAAVPRPGDEHVPPGIAVTASVRRVGQQAIAELVAAALKPDVLGDVAAWRAAARPLAAALLPDGLSGISGLLVIPDGVLWRLPVEALPMRDGVVVDAVDVTYAASLTAVLRARDAASPPSSAGSESRALIAAAPQLSAERLDVVRLTAPEWRLRVAADAMREADAAANAWAGADRLSGAAATERAFRDRAAGAGLLHVGAPFRVSSASPLFSPMLWAEPAHEPEPAPVSGAGEPLPAPPDDPQDDGVLEPREVINMELRAQAVVLSDGGALTMRDAAEAIGVIAWAWRAAGVPAVVLRRWGADGADGDALLADVVTRIREGQPVAAALRAARAAARSREAAPLGWAGWMIVR